MARQLRIEFPGAILHVTSRGIERRDIVADDFDRRTWLDLMAEGVDRFHWIVYQYVLMTNHFHFVLELTEQSLSSGMKWLNGKYGQLFNRRHHRTGHLFQGRFDSRLVQKEYYLENVIRYLALNPVRANMVSCPEDYEWSGHRAIVGLCEAPQWLAVDRTLLCFAPEIEMGRSFYRGFVDAGIGIKASPWDDLVGQIYLGTESWVEEMQQKIESKPRSDDHPLPQRRPIVSDMATVISAVSSATGVSENMIRYGRGGEARAMAAWLACNEGGLKLRSIAAGLRLKGQGSAAKLIRACEARLAGDPGWRSAMERCLESLQ